MCTAESDENLLLHKSTPPRCCIEGPKGALNRISSVYSGTPKLLSGLALEGPALLERVHSQKGNMNTAVSLHDNCRRVPCIILSCRVSEHAMFHS